MNDFQGEVVAANKHESRTALLEDERTELRKVSLFLLAMRHFRFSDA